MLNIPGDLENFAKCYRHQYLTRPEDTAYRYLLDGEDQEIRVSFKDLYLTALGIAREIRQHAQAGERVVLLYQPGIEFIQAFSACLLAGVVAVPVYPPQGPKDWPRFLGIVSDADVSLFCTSSLVYSPFVAALKMSPAVSHLPVLATDKVDPLLDPDSWDEAPGLSRDSIAFLQYTSGSTGQPKGVMVSHGNLIDNLSINVRGYQHGDDTLVVSWLPQYHDMGLIGNILLTPYIGRPLVLMSPMHFLQKPLRWLKAISKYRATASGAPNFAYELCLRKVSEAELAELDLSAWRFVYNGAEFVRKSTLESFYQKFRACGLRYESLCPIYGLAESTLIVTVADKHQPYRSLYIDPESLHRGVVRKVEAHQAGRWLVGCGVPLDQKLCIVHPDTQRMCAELEIGEIWVSGSSVAKGYWGNPEATREVFQAHISDTGEGPFLRTGDLGFLHEGELYITGRHKEMIILDGRNFYPQDVEDVIQQDRPE
ncbi:MAG: fatty acyl-AMP ligase, partial [Chitinophagales bacterium]|nr:fatty acyl-AMP ligase [Chitinophagales bacterium]